MRNIDLTKLFVAGPGDHTANFVQILIKCSVTSAAVHEIDVESGVIIPRFEPPGAPDIQPNGICFPELIAQKRREDPAATILCVMPAEDDAATIARMTYHIFWKEEIQEDPASAIAKWPELDGQQWDPVLCETAFMSNVHSKCTPETWIAADRSNIDLVIDFKTVMGLDTKDLNQIICDFLEIPRQDDLDEFIQQFRTINQKYLSY